MRKYNSVLCYVENATAKGKQYRELKVHCGTQSLRRPTQNSFTQV